jgi:hypothetical protein
MLPPNRCDFRAMRRRQSMYLLLTAAGWQLSPGGAFQRDSTWTILKESNLREI